MTTEATTTGVSSAALVRALGQVTAPVVRAGAPSRPHDDRGTDGPVDTTLCRCGHGAEAHEHYRPGSDCGVCGDEQCHRFRTPGARWRLGRA